MRLYQRSGVWWIDARQEGEGRFSLGLHDKTAAVIAAAEWLRDHERAKVGMLPVHPRFARMLLSEHVADYVGVLARRARDDEYVEKIGVALERAAGRWRRFGDITTEQVEAHLIELSARMEPTTVNLQRAYLFGFCAWMVKQRRMVVNPVAAVGRSRVVGRKRRRALTETELEGLLGRPRHVLYRVALFTGLRWGELGKLAVAHVVGLWGPSAHVFVPAAISKSGKDERVPLVAPLIPHLSALIGERGLEEPLFKMPRSKTVRRDFEKAGIPRVVGGKVASFHSLRHTFNQLLADGGASPWTAMRAMRHRSLELTDGVYGPDLPTREAMERAAEGVGV